MMFGHFVADYMRPATGIVRTTDPLYRIRQYARQGGFRSIIVTDENRPVGLIRWTDIDQARIPETSLARDLMLANSPALTRRTSIQEARIRLEIAQMDRLPVIDSDGELIGVFVQEATKDTRSMDAHGGRQASWDEYHETHVRQAFTVFPGMEVYSSEGTLLGLIDRLFLDSGTVIGFLVAYGDPHPAHKYLDIQVVTGMRNETITLSISKQAFRQLPDADLESL